MSYTLGEIAKISGAELDGDPDIKISRAASLQFAKSGDISFLANPRHARYLGSTAATAVILAKAHKKLCPVETLVSEDPYLAFTRVLRHMHPDLQFSPGIHPSAVISENCRIDDSAHVGANVFVNSGSHIAADAVIGPGCVVGKNVIVGRGTRLVANVTLCDDVQIAENGLLHPGVVVGGDGFGIVRDGDEWLKIPQMGSVRIAKNVELGANTTVDRGALQHTLIEEGVKIDNQVQVAHGVKIGAHTAIAGCVAIAGSTVIGKRCQIGGLSAISGHIEIADDVIITGMSGVSNSIKQAGIYSSGIPVTENATWRRNIVRFKNLDDFAKRLMKLEEQVDGDKD